MASFNRILKGILIVGVLVLLARTVLDIVLPGIEASAGGAYPSQVYDGQDVIIVVACTLFFLAGWSEPGNRWNRVARALLRKYRSWLNLESEPSKPELKA